MFETPIEPEHAQALRENNSRVKFSYTQKGPIEKAVRAVVRCRETGEVWATGYGATNRDALAQALDPANIPESKDRTIAALKNALVEGIAQIPQGGPKGVNERL